MSIRMQDLFEIFRHYPLLSTFLILGPLMGGAIGTYLGYDNLTTRLQNERQQDRIENRANKPNPIDQNPWAHWRSPMDMMRQG